MDLTDMPITNYDEFVRFESEVRRKIKGIQTEERLEYELGFTFVRNQYKQISQLKVDLRRNPNLTKSKEKISKIEEEINLNIDSLKDALLMTILCL